MLILRIKSKRISLFVPSTLRIVQKTEDMFFCYLKTIIQFNKIVTYLLMNE